MTTTITVKADFRAAVNVYALDRSEGGIPSVTAKLIDRVSSGSSKDFHAYETRDLFIHELLPYEEILISERSTQIPALALGENVRLKLSSEGGTIIGVAVFARQPPQFYVEYLTSDARQAQGWFDTEALERAVTP
jgi:hypothetical protein